MVSALIPCRVHRIEAAEAYPDSYDATVARNVREQREDARPAIRNYGKSCPGATVAEGLVVKGEEVREAGADIRSWLRSTGFRPAG